MSREPIKVLDKGFVRLVDVMGDDSSIVQAARVSYGKGTKSVSDDRALIRYLMRHKHTSPFEMVEFKFHIKCPIFVMRQLVRHRTASLNEYSGRYSVMPEEAYVPSPSRIQGQSGVNKQGSNGNMLVDAEEIAMRFEDEQRDAFAEYRSYLELGVARELARANLPITTYTEAYWKMDLHNLFNFIRLRKSPQAQPEIQAYAEAFEDFVADICPIAHEAFDDYVLEAGTFSKIEMLLLQAATSVDEEKMKALFEEAEGLLTKREMEDFLHKLGANR